MRSNVDRLISLTLVQQGNHAVHLGAEAVNIIDYSVPHSWRHSVHGSGHCLGHRHHDRLQHILDVVSHRCTCSPGDSVPASRDHGIHGLTWRRRPRPPLFSCAPSLYLQLPLVQGSIGILPRHSRQPFTLYLGLVANPGINRRLLAVNRGIDNLLEAIVVRVESLKIMNRRPVCYRRRLSRKSLLNWLSGWRNTIVRRGAFGSAALLKTKGSASPGLPLANFPRTPAA